MRSVLFGACLLLAACNTARVAPEMRTFAAAVGETEKAVAPILNPALEGEAERALTVAAERGDIWLLSDTCRDMIRARPGALAETCAIEKLQTDGSPRPVGAATAAARKMGVLTDYVAALTLLSEAGTEAEVTASYAAALKGLGNLAKVGESKGLSEFVAGLREEQGRTDAVASFAIQTLRYNRMRRVVPRADPDVQQVVRDIQLELFELRADPEYHRLADALIAAEDNALLADPEGSAADYRAALVQLEAAHGAFFAHYDRSIYVRVGRIAMAHGALARALRGTGSTEEVVAYLEALRELADQLEE